MKRLVLTLCAFSLAVALPAAQSAEDEMAAALMAAPPALRANAMVIKLDSGGDYTVLREGSNDLVCWDRSDEPGRSFSVQCTSIANMARIQQNRAFNMSGKTADEIRAMREEAEADGTREVSAFGSVYYTLNGADAESANMHITIAVPFANGESTGFAEEGSYTRAGTWVMEVGSSSAHIMIPGR